MWDVKVILLHSNLKSMHLCRFMRYKPPRIKLLLECFVTYIAPCHYNAIRCVTEPHDRTLVVSIQAYKFLIWRFKSSRPHGALCLLIPMRLMHSRCTNFSLTSCQKGARLSEMTHTCTAHVQLACSCNGKAENVAAHSGVPTQRVVLSDAYAACNPP